MHLAHLKVPNAYRLPESSVLLDDLNAAESLARGEATLSQHHVNIRPFDPRQDWNGKRILLMRAGSLGDILFATPMMREMKIRWPKCEITFSCLRQNMPVLLHNPDVNHLVVYPMELNAFAKFDAYFILSDTLHDGNPETHKTHAVDLLMELAGFDDEHGIGMGKELRIELTDKEIEAAQARFPRGSRKRIGVQISANTPVRSWPRENIRDFSVLAIKRGYDVYWLGYPGETGMGKTAPPEHLIDLTRCDPPLSLRESIAVASQMDGLLTPDSAFAAIGGALAIPTLALHSAFPSQIRTSYAKSVEAINGRVGCDIAPCFHSPRIGGHLFPVNGPCSTKGYCNSMANIAADRALSVLEKKMGAFDGWHPMKSGEPLATKTNLLTGEVEQTFVP